MIINRLFAARRLFTVGHNSLRFFDRIGTGKQWLPAITTAVHFHQKSSKPNHGQSVRKSINEKESFWNESNSGIYAVAIVLSSIIAMYVYERRKKDSNAVNHHSWSNDGGGHPIFCKSIPDNPDDKVKKWVSDDDDVKQTQMNKNSSAFSSMNVIADIVEQASPSVAYIEAFQRCAGPFTPMTTMTVSSGSGFLVADDGHESGIILTNAHVIANCQQVVVRFNDDRRIQGQVEFIDERLDLATVRVPLSEVSHLKPIRLLDGSKKIRPGEWVIAVGAPFSLSNTVTVGVVSSISRAARDLGIRDSVEYIQTDASINIGNSGGPLLNLEGEAIGITTLKVGEGISFAIPATYAQNFLDHCKSLRHGHRNKHSDRLEPMRTNRPKLYIGFTILTLTEPLMESYRRHGGHGRSDSSDFLPDDLRSGVMVYRVVQGSPAHKGGLKNGDIIVAINGQPVHTAEEVYKILQHDHHFNDKTTIEMEFQIRRDDKQDFKLKVRPQLII
ncbi:HTRA2-related serine protease [Dermatophagoides pteronyssinus]|uniref:HTRA2-related serine protease n=1 Tax=Dermatophagoides pteronyssinus TaxID=6956 RepID=UPI003F664A1F